MGRRWGKTVLGGCVALAAASQGAQVAWIAPTYKNSRPLWRWAENAVGPLVRDKAVSVNRSERELTFSLWHGRLGIYSAENADSMRGEAFHLVIADEASRIPEEAWTDVIQPTLADYNGDAILISTPKGKNWFYNEYQRGLANVADCMSWQAPTNANPSPQIRKAFELARERVTERTFRQEWLAQFIESGGEVFRLVRECATAPMNVDPKASHGDVVIGVDWGKSNDFTVFTALDVQARRVVEVARSNQVDYALQAQRLKVMCERWQAIQVLAESNAMGEPILEQLQRLGVPVVGFATTATSKPPLIEALAVAMEKREIAFPNLPDLVGELEAYQMKVNPVTNRATYSAPEGMHDDMVMSLALAWWAATAGVLIGKLVY